MGRGLGRSFVAKQIAKVVVFALNPITVYDRKLYLDYTDGIDHIVKEYKPYQMRVCMQHIKEGDIVVDVGANIGYFAVVASSIVGRGRIYCFEPAPSNCRLIRKNIEVNRISNVTLENQAVSDRKGTVKLYLWRETKYHRLWATERHERYVEVQSVRLDDYFANVADRIDFAKIDVVGAEAVVVAGMLGLIRKSPNLKIIMEFAAERIKGMGGLADTLLSSLRDEGFEVFELDLKAERLNRIDDLERLVHSDSTHYLFFKRPALETVSQAA